MRVGARLQQNLSYDAEEKSNAQFFAASELRVKVMGEEPLGAADFLNLNQNVLNEGLAVMQRMFVVEEAAAIEFIDWVRVKAEQPWLGLHGQYSQLLHSELTDVDANTQLPIGEGGRNTALDVVRLAAYRAIESAHLLDFEKLAQVRGDIPLPESLLADAMHLMLFKPPAVDQALLMGAVACELKVKETLRRKATSKQPWLISF
jgi:hypothetical protein